MIKSKILINDWDKVIDEFTAFMLGMDDAVEKVIIRYLYEHKGWIGFNELKDFCINKTLVCGNPSRLSRRLNSLRDFKIVEYRIEHDNKTYYKLSEEFMNELLQKKEAYY